ncbi:MAG: hypothetical protein ACLT8L_04305 [Streptococcus salivarius]
MAKNKYPSRRQAKKQTNWFLIVSSVLIVVLLVVAGAYSLFGVSHTVQQTNGSSVTKSRQASYRVQLKARIRKDFLMYRRKTGNCFW